MRRRFQLLERIVARAEPALYDSYRTAVARERRIVREKRKRFHKGLRDERAVERVGVVARQPRDPHSVHGKERQMLQAGSVGGFDQLGDVNSEILAAQTRLDRDFPKAHCGNQTFSPRRRHQLARASGKLRRVIERPKQYVRIQQKSHLPARPSKSASNSSGSGASKSSG